MSQVKVLSTWRFTTEELDTLKAVSPRLLVEQRTCRNADEVSDALDEYVEILFTYPVPEDLIHRGPHLKWIQLQSAGSDHLLNHPIRQSAILVSTSRGVYGVPIAEYVFASILMFTRRLHEVMAVRAEDPSELWDFSRFVGGELQGTTLGIVGYGNIGQRVAQLSLAFGMKAIGLRRSVGHKHPRRWRESELGEVQVWPPERLLELLSVSDFVLIALPLTEKTKALIDEQALRAMKQSAYLVNVGRYQIVDDKALIRALKEGWIAGAGLDAFEIRPPAAMDELYRLPNVILTPLLAGRTSGQAGRTTVLFCENLRRYLAGQPLLNQWNKSEGY